MAVIHRIINEPPDLGTMEEPLRGIVAACLDKDPAERPHAQALLMRLLGEEGVTPVAASPVGAPPTEILGQGAAFAGTAASAAARPPATPRGAGRTTVAGAPAPGGARRAPWSPALVGRLAAALAAGLVVWLASHGGTPPASGAVQHARAAPARPRRALRHGSCRSGRPITAGFSLEPSDSGEPTASDSPPTPAATRPTAPRRHHRRPAAARRPRRRDDAAHRPDRSATALRRPSMSRGPARAVRARPPRRRVDRHRGDDGQVRRRGRARLPRHLHPRRGGRGVPEDLRRLTGDAPRRAPVGELARRLRRARRRGPPRSSAAPAAGATPG